MSTLKADTIQNTSGGAVTLTKQKALKHYINYDAPNTTSDSSLNQSSITDYSTGDFASNFTSNFNSASDKVHFVSCLNSANDGDSRVSGPTRGGVNANIGVLINDSVAVPLSTSQIQFYTCISSTASSDAEHKDVSGSYCSSIGDLA